MDQFKIVVLGDNASNKSVLLNFLATGVIKKDKPEIIGIDYTIIEEEIINDVKYKLLFWEFSGSAFWGPPLIKQYIKNCFLAIIVVDVATKDFQTANRWKQALSENQDIPILLVVNNFENSTTAKENLEWWCGQARVNNIHACVVLNSSLSSDDRNKMMLEILQFIYKEKKENACRYSSEYSSISNNSATLANTSMISQLKQIFFSDKPVLPQQRQETKNETEVCKLRKKIDELRLELGLQPLHMTTFLLGFSQVMPSLQKNFLKQINSNILMLVTSELRTTQENFCNLINKLLNEDKIQNDTSLYQIISHIRAFRHFVRHKEGPDSIVYRNIKSTYKKLIIAGIALLSPNFQALSSTATPLMQGSTLNNKKDNQEKELEYRNEQTRLHANSSFHELLRLVWQNAISVHRYTSKKVFISYAWPLPDTNNDEEKQFIKILTAHLITAGFQVYLDNNQAGAGYPLKKFMNKIEKVDHILVISSTSMARKLQIKTSGVSQENKIIKDRLKINKNLLNERFVIPVLLNNQNYCDQEFRGLAEVPICNEGYLKSLCILIQRMYGAGDNFINWFYRKCSELDITSASVDNDDDDNESFQFR